MTTSKRKGDAFCAAFVWTATHTGTYSAGDHLNLRVDEYGGKRRFQRVNINGKRMTL